MAAPSAQAASATSHFLTVIHPLLSAPRRGAARPSEANARRRPSRSRPPVGEGQRGSPSRGSGAYISEEECSPTCLARKRRACRRRSARGSTRRPRCIRRGGSWRRWPATRSARPRLAAPARAGAHETTGGGETPCSSSTRSRTCWIRRGRRFSSAAAGQKQAMARAIWSGAISFGLVNVPVQMFSAIAEHRLHFRLVHDKDESPIGYQKICKLEDKPVADDEVVKAFEYESGEFVFMDDEDFEAARVEGYKTIEITDFVPYEQIDPIYFARTYYLAPGEGGEKVYALLLRAMEDTRLAGIAKYVMRDRQYLGALRVREGLITLEQMYFADEIRPLDELEVPKASASKEELAMAEQLIENFAGDFEPKKYEDTYRDALCEIIRAKRAGKEVHH